MLSFLFQTVRHPWAFIKRFFPKSLFGRALIILVTPLILLQMVLGYIFFDRHTETILKLLSDTIAGDIALVVDWVENDTNVSRIQKLSKDNLSLDLKILDEKSLTTVGRAKNSWLYAFMGEALDQKLNTPYHLRMDGDFIYIAVETSKNVLHFTTSRKRLFSRTTPLVLIWTTVSSVLLFIVASLFMRNQIRPIRRLAQAAEQFGKGRDPIDFTPEGGTEVRKAGFAFLMMRERVKRLLSERMQMLAGVSHDLRTPLTRLRLELAMMEKTPQNTSILDEVSTMQEMIEGYLLYARGTTNEPHQTVCMVTVLEDLIKRQNIKEFPITLNGNKKTKIPIKLNIVKRILTNIIVNSQKYGKSLRISVQTKLHHLEIIFDDDGPGIVEAERENVFKPFYRIDDARSQAQGVGLGLSIVRDGVRSHGGKIYLKTSTLGGLRVILRFPL